MDASKKSVMTNEEQQLSPAANPAAAVMTAEADAINEEQDKAAAATTADHTASPPAAAVADHAGEMDMASGSGRSPGTTGGGACAAVGSRYGRLGAGGPCPGAHGEGADEEVPPAAGVVPADWQVAAAAAVVADGARAVVAGARRRRRRPAVQACAAPVQGGEGGGRGRHGEEPRAGLRAPLHGRANGAQRHQQDHRRRGEGVGRRRRRGARDVHGAAPAPHDADQGVEAHGFPQAGGGEDEAQGAQAEAAGHHQSRGRRAFPHCLRCR